eukprot:6093920-Alexandrium_andersonii.AAC.1
MCIRDSLRSDLSQRAQRSPVRMPGPVLARRPREGCQRGARRNCHSPFPRSHAGPARDGSGPE